MEGQKHGSARDRIVCPSIRRAPNCTSHRGLQPTSTRTQECVNQRSSVRVNNAAWRRIRQTATALSAKPLLIGHNLAHNELQAPGGLNDPSWAKLQFARHRSRHSSKLRVLFLAIFSIDHPGHASDAERARAALRCGAIRARFCHSTLVSKAPNHRPLLDTALKQIPPLVRWDLCWCSSMPVDCRRRLGLTSSFSRLSLWRSLGLSLCQSIHC